MLDISTDKKNYLAPFSLKCYFWGFFFSSVFFIPCVEYSNAATATIKKLIVLFIFTPLVYQNEYKKWLFLSYGFLLLC